MQHERHYRTIGEALGVLALDIGYDPFSVGQGIEAEDGTVYRRPTKAALGALGYPVDPVLARADDERAAATRAAEERRQAEAYVVHGGHLRRAAEARKRVAEDEATAKRAREIAQIPLQACSIEYFEGGLTHVIFADRRVILTGDEGKVTPITLNTVGVTASGRRVSTRIARRDGQPLMGYILQEQLGDDTWWTAVRASGEAQRCGSECAAAAILMGEGQ